jgi:gas vesicle protein
VDDRTRIALGIGVGAIVGGFVGFLLFTERGKSFRRELEPQLDSLLGEAQRLSVAFDRTRRAVKDGLATLTPADETPSGEGRADWSH